MCCDICPYFDDCQEAEKLRDGCCPECPDYEECMGEERIEEEEEEEF